METHLAEPPFPSAGLDALPPADIARKAAAVACSLVAASEPSRTRSAGQTFFGTLPLRVKTNRIALCPRSAVGPNMHGQPPSITAIPRRRP
jgi:hypothetical protein